MDLDDAAVAGMIGGAVAGAVTALMVTADFLLFRHEHVAAIRTALEIEGVPTAGLDPGALYWMSLVVTPPFVLGLTLVLGTVVAVVLGSLDVRSPPVVVGAAVVLGIGDGFTTQLAGFGRPVVVGVSIVAWLGFAAVYLRAARGEDEATDLLPKVTLDWRLVPVLLAAGAAGLLSLAPALLAGGQSPVAVVGTLVLTGTLVLAAVLVGTALGAEVGLGAPVVAAWLDGEPPARRPVAVAAGAGLATGGLLLALDVLVFGPLVEGALREGATGSLAAAPGPARLLAGLLYGGVVEELLLRLGLLTALVWLAWRAGLRHGDAPAGWVPPAAIVLSALAFGASHLPATAAAFDLTAAVVARALVLNGAGGVVFGWLYWRRGLLAAVVAHASANLVLQGVAVLLA